MNFIKENILALQRKLPKDVCLVAVSKTHPVSMIKEAYDSGQKVFGENKVQELVAKYEELKGLDIKWHLIGHLQRNKVKYIAEFVDMIHSVDSLKLLIEINKQAIAHKRVIKCLLQFHIASEETKFGLDYDEAVAILSSDEYKNITNVEIVGVMGMATFTDDREVVGREFVNLSNMYKKIKTEFFLNQAGFKEISMGMSSDWDIAIEKGSTMVRVGSIIFGNRNYNI